MPRTPPTLVYDRTRIPVRYDQGRSRSPEVMAAWMDAVAANAPTRVARVLDLGCGTGRFSQSLADRFGARVIGVDPSHRMLAHASAKRTAALELVAGRGESVPLADGSVDLVFMSMVFHHFTDPAQVARECFRVLGPRGRVFIRGSAAERIPTYPISPFFPEAVPIMERLIPPVAAIVEPFELAGFRLGEAGLQHQEIAKTHADFADQLEAGADSILARLDEDQLAEGLRAIRSHAAVADPAPVRELIDFFSFVKAG